MEICASSRPWNTSWDKFEQKRSLRLEAITYSDIRFYEWERFCCSRGFEERRIETLAEANQLIENIMQKSSRVFLWVALVTDPLLEGLTDG